MSTVVPALPPEEPRLPYPSEPVRALRRHVCGELVRDGEEHECPAEEPQELAGPER